MDYINTLSKYNFQPLVYGKNDCNIQFLECYEPDIFSSILGKYKTEIGGARKAKQLCGYRSIHELVSDNPSKYATINKNFVRIGDFFIDGVHIAICLGDKTFAYTNGQFRAVDTNLFISDDKYLIYRKVV